MSGGTFDYNQRHIREIAERIEHEIAISGKPKSQRELKEEGWYRDSSWYEKYPEDLNHHQLRDEIITEFKNAYEILRKAEIYAQRIDWYLAGDDGEDSFLERLEDELDILKFELSVKEFKVEDDEDED
jgi:TFIIF-interacting CTD phosphatase-like protein